MIEAAKRLLRSHALRLALVVWTFGYLLVDFSALLQRRTVPLGMFAVYLPFLVAGVALTVLLSRYLDASRGLNPFLRWPALMAMILVISIAQALIDLVYLQWIGENFFHSWRKWALVNTSRTATTGVLYTWTYCLGLTLIWAGGVSNAARLVEARAAAFEAASHRAEAAALRLQLNPHFLFNTLNGIASLIVTHRAREAEEMLGRLADFLRAALASDPTAEVPLADELATVEAYLSIEGARFSDRMKVTVDVPTELREARVPNFILQPLVENAVKHGVSQSRGLCAVVVIARRAPGDVLELSVVNRGSPTQRRTPSPARRADAGSRAAIGLANVAQRLSLAYGDQGQLSTQATADGFEAVVRLPLVIASPSVPAPAQGEVIAA